MQNVHPGQRVIARDGKVYVVALIVGNRVYAYDGNGSFKAIQVVCDAWGGEHDQALMNAA